MSFTFPSQGGASYQRGAYSSISTQEKKASVSLNDALEGWQNNDEIKYHQGENGQTSYYYSDSQQPEGFLESGHRFFAHLANREAQALHRRAIDAVVKDLKTSSATSTKSAAIEQDFKLRKMLGQPLSIGALKQSLSQIEHATSPKETSSLPFNIFGKRGTPKVSSILQKAFSSPRSSSKKGYQSRGSSILRKSLASLLSTKHGYQRISEKDTVEGPQSSEPSRFYQAGSDADVPLTDQQYTTPQAPTQSTSRRQPQLEPQQQSPSVTINPLSKQAQPKQRTSSSNPPGVTNPKSRIKYSYTIVNDGDDDV